MSDSPIKPIAPEVKAKVLSAVNRGVAVADAAKEHNLRPDTIRRWIRKAAPQEQTSSTETKKLRAENQQLREMLSSLLIEREMKKMTSDQL